MVGVEMDGAPLERWPVDYWPALGADGTQVGTVTSATYSPRLDKNIGYVWVPIELASPGHVLDVESEHGLVQGTTAAIPFVDPGKRAPAAVLGQH
jgi:aminomethyltransferase